MKLNLTKMSKEIGISRQTLSGWKKANILEEKLKERGYKLSDFVEKTPSKKANPAKISENPGRDKMVAYGRKNIEKNNQKIEKLKLKIKELERENQDMENEINRLMNSPKKKAMQQYTLMLKDKELDFSNEADETEGKSIKQKK